MCCKYCGSHSRVQVLQQENSPHLSQLEEVHTQCCNEDLAQPKLIKKIFFKVKAFATGYIANEKLWLVGRD